MVESNSKNPSSMETPRVKRWMTRSGILLMKRRVILLVLTTIACYLILFYENDNGEPLREALMRERNATQYIEVLKAALKNASTQGKADAIPFPLRNSELERSIHMHPMCGNWQKDYLSLHEEMLRRQKESQSGKFLVFSSCNEKLGCGGFGDHLCGVISTLMLAVHFKRAFLMDWEELRRTGMFLPSSMDWSVQKELNLTKDPGTPRQNCNLTDVNGAVELDFMNFGSPVESYKVFSCLEKLENVSVVWIHINRGFSYWATSEESSWGDNLRNLGFRSPFAAGCLLRFLFQPSILLEERAAPYISLLRKEPSTLSVCIHARHGWLDTEFNKKDLDLEGYILATKPLFDCAKRLSSYWAGDLSEPVWFFMTPLLELKRVAWGAYGDKVITTTFESLHAELSDNRTLALENAITDWYIFSKCNFFVIHDSGLSKTAAAFSLRPMSLYVYDRIDSSGECNPDRPSDFETFGTTWSGI